MAFTTKKYTRPVLLANLRKVSASDYKTFNTLAQALSPRAGARSAQFSALNNLVSGAKLRNVFKLNSGVYAKRLILDLIKNA